MTEQIREFLRFETQSRRRFGKSIPEPTFYGMCDLIEQHGQPFQANRLPRRHKLNAFAKQCFFNCYRAIARKTTPWVYVEGYAITGSLFMPVHHGSPEKTT